MDEWKIYDWPTPYEAVSEGEREKYIFISYSHEDTDIVYQDLMLLINNGARIWYDKGMHVGQNWIECAKNKIMDSNCVAVLVYVSSNSLRSPAILQELDLVLERKQKDSSFSYMSVNLEGRTAFEILKSIDIDETLFLKFLTAFNQKKLFIPRSTDPFNQEHIVSLLDVFEEKDAIDLYKCVIGKTQLFEYAPYEQGVQIIKYRGADSIVTVPSEANGKKVLAIGINAFCNNTRVRKVNAPEGIRVIDDFAFSGCSKLESISLPNSLVRLGYESFRECSSLQEIVIPYNVEKIGDYCFYRCHNLFHVMLLSSVPLYIAFAAFSECQAIERIELPETTMFLGPYVFNNCINLREIVLPPRISEIGLSAFYNCASLQRVEITTNTFLKNNRWFARCRELKEVVLYAKDKTQYDTDVSWDTCKALLVFKLNTPQNIVFESNLLSWDMVEMADYYDVSVNGKHSVVEQPFMELSNRLEEENLNVVITACSYDETVLNSDESTEVSVKSVTKRYEIEYEGESVVLTRYNGSSASVEIPDNITVIAEGAFYNHEEIRNVKLPRGLRKIGAKAFYHCVNLQELYIPDTVEEIGDEAFWGAQIKELELPVNVKRAGAMCFACCNYLTSVRILSRDLVAGNKMFYRCINLKNVMFPNGFGILYDGMFRGCTELEDIELPDGLKAIRSGAVSYIMCLERVTIPRTVEVIESEAFSCSFGLSEILVDERNEVYYDMNGVLYKKANNCIEHYPADRKAEEYVVDDTVTEIADYAFMDAEHLERIIIGSGVSAIGTGAFERCPNLKEVIIQGELDYIKRDAFKDCIHLERVVLNSKVVPEIQTGLFDNVSASIKIYVPKKYIKNYMRIIEWQEYCHLLTEYNPE